MINKKTPLRVNKKLPFRAWYYLRMGWTTYFAFIFTAVNTLVITYYLAIERLPTIKEVFPTFSIYALVMIIIGLPILVLAGYIHFKKSKAFPSEMDIIAESNPYYFKLPPGHNRQVLFPILLLISKMLVKTANNQKLTEKEIVELNELENKINILIKGGSVGKPEKT